MGMGARTLPQGMGSELRILDQVLWDVSYIVGPSGRYTCGNAPYPWASSIYTLPQNPLR